ncbi:hypothetical protein HMI55_004765 [Coelomomyces lativittatus]|nr:hypothetical protein HMI55_004765 [Coelomomyces lativittatus]
MLILDATKRATMKDIRQDKWFNDECEDTLPLFQENPTIQLNPEDQAAVLKSCEDIGLDLEALDKSLKENVYDSLAATYYLLSHRLFQKKYAEHVSVTLSTLSTTETPPFTSSTSTSFIHPHPSHHPHPCSKDLHQPFVGS